jgi:hypothetical protein
LEKLCEKRTSPFFALAFVAFSLLREMCIDFKVGENRALSFKDLHRVIKLSLVANIFVSNTAFVRRCRSDAKRKMLSVSDG